MAYIDSDVLEDDVVEVDIRGKRVKAVIPARHMSVGAPPFARPLIYKVEEEAESTAKGDRTGKAVGAAEESRRKPCVAAGAVREPDPL